MNRRLGVFVTLLATVTMCSIVSTTPVSAAVRYDHDIATTGINVTMTGETKNDITTKGETVTIKNADGSTTTKLIATTGGNNSKPDYMTAAEWEQYKKDGIINEKEGTKGFYPFANGLRILYKEPDGKIVSLTWEEYKKAVNINVENGDYTVNFAIPVYVLSTLCYEHRIITYDTNGNVKCESAQDRDWSHPIELKLGWTNLLNHWYYCDNLNEGWATSTWKQVNGEWYYFGNNSMAVAGWQQIDGKWYWFDSKSYNMLHDTYVQDYYLTSSGSMA